MALVDTLGSVSDPAKIREAELPKSFRGFDETATRKLLNEVADVVRSLTTEREQLRRQVESLQAAGGTDTQSPEAIGNAILAAERAGEALIAEAKEEAALLLSKAMAEAAEAKRELDEQRAQIAQDREQLDRDVVRWEEQVAGERDRLMAEADAEAQAILAASEQRLVDLRDEEEKLKRRMLEQHNQAVGLLRSALRELEPLDAPSDSADLSAALVLRAADGSRQTAGSKGLPPSEN